MENLAELLRERCQADPNKSAFLVKELDKWREITWLQVDQMVERVAAGLLSCGIRPGDRLAILGNTRLEWTLSDLAAIRIGAVSVGIYQTLSPDQCRYILEDSGTKALFVENREQREKVAPLLKDLPDLKTIITWDADDDRHISMEKLMQTGKESLSSTPELVRDYESAIRSDQIAIIIYTSGTTGPPKGACLTHKNILAELEQINQVFNPDDVGEIMMFFLPLSHVGERVPGQFMRIARGITAAYVRDINKVLDDIAEIKPTFFGSVPRIFEKAYARIQNEVNNASPLKRNLFRWAENTGRQVSRLKQKKEPIPIGLKIRYNLADKLVLHKIRDLFGGRVKYFLSSSAPIALDIIEFFHACGLLILEAYGQTEVSCFCTLSLPDSYRFGSVGKAMPDTELRIAEDGEILVKGEIVFKKYLNQPDLTANTLTEDGWIKTGDIGRLDEDGFLWITGRKKEIIITSGGKNVTPSNIEFLLMKDPLIEAAMVHGDRRNFLTALISLSPDHIAVWGEKTGYPGLDFEAYTKLPEMLELVQKRVDEANLALAKFETIKKFAILPRPLQVETGELTPTMKIRRKIVEEKYRQTLDSFYE